MTVTGGSRRPTQRDIARRAGVSTATVSYVLSGRRAGLSPPSPATTERVLAAAAALGYERDHVARSLRRRRTDAVALVYPAPSSPWSDQLAAELQQAAAGRGLTVIALPLSTTTPTDALLRPLREGYVDGAILLPDCPVDAESLTSLADRGVSLVVFDDELQPAGFDVVHQGRRAACSAAMERLAALGHRRIAYLAHPHEGVGLPRSVKLQSYLDAHTRHGLDADPSLVLPVADSRPDAYAAVRDLLQLPDPPTALFSATDRAAIDGIWAARDLGKRVPADLAVVGVGNIPEGLMISPTLTTVGIPELDFSPQVERLFARLEGTDEDHVQDAPWQLIVRDSDAA